MHMSNSNVTVRYSFNLGIDFLDNVSNQVYIRQRGIMINWTEKNFLN